MNMLGSLKSHGLAELDTAGAGACTAHNLAHSRPRHCDKAGIGDDYRLWTDCLQVKRNQLAQGAQRLQVADLPL